MMNDVFTALADPSRRAMLDQLRQGPCPAGQLRPAAPMSQPAVSRHLRVLRDAGLVRATKAGRENIYELVPERLQAVSDWIAHYQHFWSARLDALGEVLDAMDGEP